VAVENASRALRKKEILMVFPETNLGEPMPSTANSVQIVGQRSLWTASREFLNVLLIVLVVWMVLVALIGFLVTAGLFLLGVLSVVFAIVIPYGAGTGRTEGELGGRQAYEMRRAGSIRLFCPIFLCCILSFVLISTDFYGIVGWLFHRDKKPTTAQTSTAKETKTDLLKKGMSYAEVVKIMGSEGKKIEGEKGAPDDELYEWSDDHAVTRVTFRKDKAIAIKPNIPLPNK
jgi:hypothetical protein